MKFSVNINAKDIKCEIYSANLNAEKHPTRLKFAHHRNINQTHIRTETPRVSGLCARIEERENAGRYIRRNEEREWRRTRTKKTIITKRKTHSSEQTTIQSIKSMCFAFICRCSDINHRRAPPLVCRATEAFASSSSFFFQPILRTHSLSSFSLSILHA